MSIVSTSQCDMYLNLYIYKKVNSINLTGCYVEIDEDYNNIENLVISF